MYTKTFEADTLDEALKAIKFELGPDAIILKTTTNKGLKGAFKKKRIEITAAIPDRSYENKSRVDHVLNPEQKTQFYNSPAEHISKSIEKFNNKGGQSRDARETKNNKEHTVDRHCEYRQDIPPQRLVNKEENKQHPVDDKNHKDRFVMILKHFWVGVDRRKNLLFLLLRE